MFDQGLIMNTEVSSVTRSRAAIRRIIVVCILWATLVLVVLSVQAWSYTGLFSQLAEWQFTKFKRMFPAMTITAIAFLSSLPLLVLLSIRVRRHRKYYGPPTLEHALEREVRISHFLLSVIGALTVLCLISFVLAINKEKPLTTLSTSLNYLDNVRTQEGPLETEAVVLHNRIASYRQDTALFQSALLLAPVTQGDDAKSLKYFKVISKIDARPASTEKVSGYVREIKLPGGFQRLFTNSGYTVSNPAYVIYPNANAALAPKFGLTETILRFALLFLLGFVIHRLYLRRVRREYKDSINSET